MEWMVNALARSLDHSIALLVHYNALECMIRFLYLLATPRSNN